MAEPRVYTTDEVREMFLKYVDNSVNYWTNGISHEWSAARAVRGVAFSILVALDGEAADLPAFMVIPSPHETDEAYHREQGENWFPSMVVSNVDESSDCLPDIAGSLHDEFVSRQTERVEKMIDKWGVGDQADAKAWGKALIGDPESGSVTEVELIHGQYPHSRSDNTTYARTKEGRIIGFDGHRILKTIIFSDRNRLKESDLSGDEVRAGSSCAIYFNGIQLYEFGFKDFAYGAAKAVVVLTDLCEKAVAYTDSILDGSDGRSLKGQKVWYLDQPGLIDHVMPDQGAVTIIPDPDYLDQFAPAYSLEDMAEDDDRDCVKEDVLSLSISWYRGTEEDNEYGPRFPKRKT